MPDRIARMTPEAYGKLLRHTVAHIEKWQAREALPPPHRCPCGEFLHGPTMREFSAALMDHVRQHAPEDSA